MKTAAQEKGDQLEEAMALIENIIHFDEVIINKYNIEQKQKFCGGMHEIDIVVKVAPKGRVRAYYLFECKNRRKKAGKDDVIILYHKVIDYTRKVLGDPIAIIKGILVAKNFTRHSRIKAAELGIELVKASDVIDSIQEPGISYCQVTDISYMLFGNSSLSPKPVFIEEGSSAISLHKQQVIHDIHGFCCGLFTAQTAALAEYSKGEVEREATVETNIYKSFYVLPTRLEDPLLYRGVIITTIEFCVVITLWYSVGAFEVGFDVEGKKRIVTRRLTMPFGKSIPVQFIKKSST